MARGAELGGRVFTTLDTPFPITGVRWLGESELGVRFNLGPGRVKRAVRKVDDPIKQRNFWYLYRVRTLPAETREYVPKIIAAIIIGRNPEQFGFVS